MDAVIIGYGKMGHEIEKILTQKGHRVVMTVDAENVKNITPQALRQSGAGVAFEFTQPDSALRNVSACLEAGLAVVCGTTGWNDGGEQARELCRKGHGAFFYASNFSVGMNATFHLNEVLARIMNSLPDYDVTVEEVHHTQKKDAPSGTAVTLAEAIVAQLGRKKTWVGEVSTEPCELEVISLRRGTAPGSHTVTYESPADIIVLEHTSKNRSGLAAGAVMAAEFIEGRKGCFSMSDLLGF